MTHTASVIRPDRFELEAAARRHRAERIASAFMQLVSCVSRMPDALLQRQPVAVSLSLATRPVVH